jgi:hypothetical protein
MFKAELCLSRPRAEPAIPLDLTSLTPVGFRNPPATLDFQHFHFLAITPPFFLHLSSDRMTPT